MTAKHIPLRPNSKLLIESERIVLDGKIIDIAHPIGCTGISPLPEKIEHYTYYSSFYQRRHTYYDAHRGCIDIGFDWVGSNGGKGKFRLPIPKGFELAYKPPKDYQSRYLYLDVADMLANGIVNPIQWRKPSPRYSSGLNARKSKYERFQWIVPGTIAISPLGDAIHKRSIPDGASLLQYLPSLATPSTRNGMTSLMPTFSYPKTTHKLYVNAYGDYEYLSVNDTDAPSKGSNYLADLHIPS